jgi:protein AATF/BFR2
VDDDEDDPFTRVFHDEEGSEDLQDDRSNDGKIDKDIGEEPSDDGEQISLSDSDEEEPRRPNGYGHAQNEIDRAEVRKLMADDYKTIAANLSQSARADAEKGQAVQKQRATFDALLNLRIKLQKALIAVNSLPSAEREGKDGSDLHEDAISNAEGAAITLFNDLSSLRSAQAARSGTKRKYAELSTADNLFTPWEAMKGDEAEAIRQRNSTLDFWSAKCRATTTTLQPRKLGAAQPERSLSDVLTGHLSDMSRLVSRTRIPRSCAPVQAAAQGSTKLRPHDQEPNKVSADDEAEAHSLPIYDDADFYSLLLQSLISQKSSTNGLNLASIEPWQAAREAKVKRAVDTRASKGRKLRYTVHEKLVNFMAPEDRNGWGGRQIEDLFGGLFGGSVKLGEDRGVDDGANIEQEDNREVEGLRLFAGP